VLNFFSIPAQLSKRAVFRAERAGNYYGAPAFFAAAMLWDAAVVTAVTVVYSVYFLFLVF
jgi:hypothetical protein